MPSSTDTFLVSLFLGCIVVLAGGFFFAGRFVAPDGVLGKSLTAAWFTLLALVIFIGFFWAFRGFPPGSRLVVGELPTENDLLADQATFMFFYTDWCPYSEDALPKVRSLAGIVPDFTYGGKTVSVETVNCEVDRSKCRSYSVTAYPTYKLITASKVYEYSGPPRTATYEEFLTSALGNKVAKPPST